MTTAPIPPALRAAAEQTPEPLAVVARLTRLAEAGADLEVPDLGAILVQVIANSRVLAAFLARHPAEVARLADHTGLSTPLSAEALRGWYAERAAPPEDEDAVAAALRFMKYRAFVHITARDVGLHAPVPEICAELSLVAEVAAELALDAARRQIEARHGPCLGPDGAPLRFVILGMGKLGGRELNYSSDIDLLYFYDRDEGAAGDLTPHQLFTRVGERLTRLLGQATADGIVFRVDLRLRPEGQSGPLCNSLAAAEAYYEAWGRLWERVAWLRARPIAGDLDLGAELLARLDPWIYRRTLDLRVLDQVRALGAQALRARPTSAPQAGIDLKLDQGGIRAVEFSANALQLLYAGRDARLRDPSTLGALDRLFAAGLLDDTSRDRLAEGYLFYRRVEHRLQMEDERQTQRLPSGPALDRLARRLGLEGGPALLALVEGHRARISAIFEEILGGPAEETFPPEARALLALEATREDRVALLQAAGLLDPEQAVHLLESAGRQPGSPLSPRAGADRQRLGLLLLTEVLRSAEPERALTWLAAFIAAQGPRDSYLRALAGHPPLACLLIGVFATSDLLSGLLVRQPALLDALFDRRRPDDLSARLAQAVAGAPAGELYPRLEALARLQQAEIVRIGLADIAGELDAEGVEAALSTLAEDLIEVILALAEAMIRRGPFGGPRAPDGRPGRCCVIGMGKLGGRALSYGSDLDLVFLYDTDGETDGPRPITHLEWYSRLAQRVISLLGAFTAGGPLYTVDTRLRPGGSQGTLVTRLARFIEHHEGPAGTWERLALVRARPVAGDAGFMAEVAAALGRLTYDRPPPPGFRAEIMRLRRRMEVEVAREGPGRYNPKLGRGGLVDIEFIAQALQIEQGATRHPLRTPGTLPALQALRAAGLLESGEELISAWRFLRRLEHRLRILRGQPVPELRADPQGLNRLARRLGYRHDPLAPTGGDPGTRLLASYERTTARVRAHFNRLFLSVETGETDGSSEQPEGGQDLV